MQGQLQQLRLEEKRLKQSLKEEKRRLKAEKMQKIMTLQMSSSSSSSESSDSSDSDCGPVGTMNRLNCKPKETQIPDIETLAIPRPSTAIPQKEETTTPDNSQNATSTTTMVVGNKAPVVTKKIEVCMGGKCKKSGAGLLLEKFQNLLDVETVVCGCKCMGKCRDGPNVRISENLNEDMGSATNHFLQIGVGLEDVDLIVQNILGGSSSQENLDLAAAAAASY